MMYIWNLIIAALCNSMVVKMTEREYSRQLNCVNSYRMESNLIPLRAFYELDEVATWHSEYMARKRRCNHDNFEIRVDDIEHRLEGSGYIGENVAIYPSNHYDRHTASKLVNMWMNSEGHRANIMNPSFRAMGIGIVIERGKVYATQIFTGASHNIPKPHKDVELYTRSTNRYKSGIFFWQKED